MDRDKIKSTMARTPEAMVYSLVIFVLFSMGLYFFQQTSIGRAPSDAEIAVDLYNKSVKVHDLAVELQTLTQQLIALRNRAVVADDEAERQNLFKDILIMPRLKDIEKDVTKILEE